MNENTFSPVAKSLKNLRLNENIINDISPNTFTKLKVIKDIELKSNQIQHLKKEALSTSFMSYEGKRTLNLEVSPNIESEFHFNQYELALYKCVVKLCL